MRLPVHSVEQPTPARRNWGARDVRQAVRKLALHALLGQPLTPARVAVIARTIGQGIDQASVPDSPVSKEVCRSARRGLADAVECALQALEIAVRQGATREACDSLHECGMLRDELGALSRDLANGAGLVRWGAAERSRLAATIARLASALSAIHAQEHPPGDPVTGSGRIVALASAILVTLEAGPLEGTGRLPH